MVSKKIDGKEAIQCLSIRLETKPKPSDIAIHPLFRKIVQPLYQNYAVDEKFTISNSSAVDRKFKISRINQDDGVESVCSEFEGVVEA